MREATGELNMTVITVVIIAALVGLVIAFVIPAIQGSLTASTRCSGAFGCGACNNNQRQCAGYYDQNGNAVNDAIQCQCNE